MKLQPRIPSTRMLGSKHRFTQPSCAREPYLYLDGHLPGHPSELLYCPIPNHESRITVNTHIFEPL